MCDDKEKELKLPDDPEPVMLHETFTSTDKKDNSKEEEN